MRTVNLAVWLLAGTTLSCPIARADDRIPREREDLSILYAGYPGGPREKAWTEFLKRWFSKVESIDLRKLSVRSAADFDVVVADWTSRYENGRYNPGAERHNTSLGKDFTKPIIMIGAVGAELTRRIKLKTDWL